MCNLYSKEYSSRINLDLHSPIQTDVQRSNRERYVRYTGMLCVLFMNDCDGHHPNNTSLLNSYTPWTLKTCQLYLTATLSNLSTILQCRNWKWTWTFIKISYNLNASQTPKHKCVFNKKWWRKYNVITFMILPDHLLCKDETVITKMPVYQARTILKRRIVKKDLRRMGLI